jgi:8-oxo-dGTP pyrophosphatase MutT (NUDIX family)
VPNSTLFTHDGKLVFASDWIGDLVGNAAELDLLDDAQTGVAFMEGFCADVLAANWDAVGKHGHNLLVRGPGGVVRCDNGGAFLTRGRGQRKHDNLLTQATGIRGFFDPAVNPAYARLAAAAGCTDALDIPSLRAQVRNITALRDRSGGWRRYAALSVPGMPAELLKTMSEMLRARHRALRDLATHRHPHANDGGEPVRIHQPTQASVEHVWKYRRGHAIFVPEGRVSDQLYGVAMTKWSAPDDLDGWCNVPGQDPALDRNMPFMPAPGKKAAAGAVIVEWDRRIWLTEPTNHYGGYEKSFPKGRVEPGLSLQATAIKEVYEETGMRVKLVGVLGDYEGHSTTTRIYLAVRTGGTPADMGWECQGLHLVPSDKAQEVLNRDRDRGIASDAAARIAAANRLGERKLASTLLLARPELARGRPGSSGAIRLDQHYRSSRALRYRFERRIQAGYYHGWPQWDVLDWSERIDALQALIAADPRLTGIAWQDLMGVNLYETTHFREMNRVLRVGTWAGSAYAPEIALATSGLNQLPPFEGTLFRYLTMPPSVVRRLFVPNRTTVERGFWSATREKHNRHAPWVVDNSNVLLVIETEIGSDIAPISLTQAHREVIFIPNTAMTTHEVHVGDDDRCMVRLTAHRP